MSSVAPSVKTAPLAWLRHMRIRSWSAVRVRKTLVRTKQALDICQSDWLWTCCELEFRSVVSPQLRTSDFLLFCCNRAPFCSVGVKSQNVPRRCVFKSYVISRLFSLWHSCYVNLAVFLSNRASCLPCVYFPWNSIYIFHFPWRAMASHLVWQMKYTQSWYTHMVMYGDVCVQWKRLLCMSGSVCVTFSGLK